MFDLNLSILHSRIKIVINHSLTLSLSIYFLHIGEKVEDDEDFLKQYKQRLIEECKGDQDQIENIHKLSDQDLFRQAKREKKHAGT